jgi:hypothetical protein
MNLIKLPAPQVPPVPDFTVGADLDGVSYTLRFMFNAGDGYWYMRVLDALAQTVLMGDRRVVADTPIYAAATGRNPPGLFLAKDTTGQGLAPGLSDFGTRVLLYYVTAAELAALGIAA